MPVKMFVELWRSRLYVSSKYNSPLAHAVLRGILRVAMWKDNATAAARALLGHEDKGTIATMTRAKAVLRMLARE